MYFVSRPLRTLRNESVHPTDKVDYEEVSECIYQIPCKNCDKVYVGQTARNLGIRVGEHKKVEAKDTLKFTWISKKAANEQQNKSAITDHTTREKHVIDRNGVKVGGHETNYRTRWIKEATAIQSTRGEP